jgi:hypothetical protein
LSRETTVWSGHLPGSLNRFIVALAINGFDGQLHCIPQNGELYIMYTANISIFSFRGVVRLTTTTRKWSSSLRYVTMAFFGSGILGNDVKEANPNE